MAIGAGTFTLADYALYSNNPPVQAISMSLIDYGIVARDIPLVTKASLIQNGVGVVLYMNDYVNRRINSVLKFMGTSGGFDQGKDQFDRVFDKYKSAIIRDPGVKSDQSTRILAGNAIASGTGSVGETAAGLDSTGASANFASIYAVNYGTDHLMGWQMTEGPDVNDLGLINNGVIYRTVIDWAVGLMNQSTRSIGRLYDIKIG